MKKAIAIVFILFPHYSYSASCSDLPFYGFKDYGGNEYAFYASEKDLSDVPTWHADSKEPPLSIGDATKTANTWATEYEHRLSLTMVLLMKRGCDNLQGHWVYLFMYQSDNPEHTKTDGFEMIGVLLNGQRLVPQKKPAY